MRFMSNQHFGRTFDGTSLEDSCPCGKGPCGLVDNRSVHPRCPEHSLAARKTLRQGHAAAACPAGPVDTDAPVRIFPETHHISNWGN